MNDVSRSIHLEDIPNFNRFSVIEEIVLGWSSDRKFLLQDVSGNKYLLRVSDINNSEQKEAEFLMIQQATLHNIPTNQPIEYGICNRQQSTYMLLSWVEGDDASNILPTLARSEQYRLGIVSGRYLKRIHALEAPLKRPDWESFYIAKTKKRIESWKAHIDSDFVSGKEECFLEYIEDNWHLLKGRPTGFQHGDYHTGNMVIDSTHNLHIIDWNRYDCGDPYEEFIRIVFSVEVCRYFASGQLFGYFEQDPPIEFFKLLAMYIASNQIGVVGWAMNNSKTEKDLAIRQNLSVASWYDDMKNIIPSWYINGETMDKFQ